MTKFFWWSQRQNHQVITFFSKCLFFKKAWGSHFCWQHQNFNHVYYSNLEDSRKVKTKQKLFIKMQSVSVFLDIAKLADFPWKSTDVSRTQGVCHVIHIFLDILWLRYNCANFHHCRIYMTYFREEKPSHQPPSLMREQPWKSPSWIGLRTHLMSTKLMFFSVGKES